MDKARLVKVLNEELQRIGFRRIRDGWAYPSAEARPMQIIVGLQKARYGNEYHFWTKVFVDGAFGRPNRPRNRFPIKELGTVFRVEQTEYLQYFDLENRLMTDEERSDGLRRFVNGFLANFVETALSDNGIVQLANRKLVFVTPPLVEELSRLGYWKESR